MKCPVCKRNTYNGSFCTNMYCPLNWHEPMGGSDSGSSEDRY